MLRPVAFSVALSFAALVRAAGVSQQQGLQQAAASRYTAEAEADRVANMPGLGKPRFGLFSGYEYFVCARSAA